MIYGIVAALLAEGLTLSRTRVAARHNRPEVKAKAYLRQSAGFGLAVTFGFIYASGQSIWQDATTMLALILVRFVFEAFFEPVMFVSGFPSVQRSVERSALNELPLEVAALDYALNAVGEAVARNALIAFMVCVAWEVRTWAVT